MKEDVNMNAKFVKENIENVEEYVRVNVVAMKQAYYEFVNEEFLDLINSEDEIKKNVEKHKERLNNPNEESYIFYVDNKPVGIIRYGKCRRQTYNDKGEFYALYLLDEFKNKGYGRVLFNKGIKGLLNMGYSDMIVDCLEDNPTNGFYQYFGGKIIDTDDIKMLNQNLLENIYLFQSIDNIIK